MAEYYLSTEDQVLRVERSMAKLAEVSEIAKLYYTGNSLYLIQIDDQHHFTATGKCGVIHNDSMFMGFDSNYIMWYEGYVDGMRDDAFPTCYKCIYLYSVTSQGITQIALALSTHYYKDETMVLRVDPETEIRRVDFISKGQYTLISDTEPTLSERFVVTRKGTDEVLDDVEGNCFRSQEKAIRHYQYISNKQ